MEKTVMRSLGVAVVALFLVACAFSLPAAAATVGGVDVSPKAAPDFELQDVAGSTVSLSKFKGDKPVLIYFWATWCPHCMAVRPEVLKLRNDIPKGDLELLAINVGGGDSLAKLKRFEEAHPSTLTSLYDPEGKVARSYKVQGIPHFILIDKNGMVKYSSNELPENTMQLLKK
ncbi:MAG: TlpA disulfide reductase family protein [Syntrophobacteraceae bacterium]